ncbi:spermatogenesis-associated protein 17 isoform X2 [Heterodontus francisci]|uniref:spermatogenesis-associated protein 17 isoform X2 n=1 Tax=Heterodontus francisci TaxID=7792 RepID=UPI00355AFC43
MATLAALKMHLQGLNEEYCRRNWITEENRLREHCAAVKIQSCYRGFKTRAHLRYLQKIAIVIQKTWRGYRSRVHFRTMVQRAYFIMKMNFYNEMAVRIQKRWRGYYVRKCIHNYYDMKKYFKGLSMKNQIIRKELEEYEETKKKEREKKAVEEEERRKHYQARKMHYLLSTEQLPGIYNSPCRLCPDEMEYRLQQVRPLTPNTSQKEEATEGLVDPSIPDVPCTFPPVGLLPTVGKNKPQVGVRRRLQQKGDIIQSPRRRRSSQRMHCRMTLLHLPPAQIFSLRVPSAILLKYCNSATSLSSQPCGWQHQSRQRRRPERR